MSDLQIDNNSNNIEISISKEMQSSFIDYAMSIIVSRALPDARDGLKPVHRRILYAMKEIGLSSDKPYKKCARIVGEVLGKYHPHGDTAVYDALVRLAQSFSSRYKLVAGHGNFGSLDDNAAAMRYTEARMSKLSEDLLADIDSDTVDFQDNFDGSLEEPTVLPSKLPTLLLNGTTGIAVGMATNIPPHNLTEVLEGLIFQIDNPECTISDLMEYIKGPDFPSGGYIMGMSGIRSAFETGKGSVKVRGKATIEEIKHKSSTVNAIVITELPYLVGPENLIAKIADLVKAEKIKGISDLNDESDRKGTRVVIKLKRDANPDIVLNNLYKLTPLQQSFSTNTLALVDGRPELLNLKRILSLFIDHRVEIITRKAKFDLNKAQIREHIVSGLIKALDIIDPLIKTIKAANSTDEARQNLIAQFEFTEQQSNAILEMQLRRLTGLERNKLEDEHSELNKRIAYLISLIGDKALVLNVIKEDFIELKAKHGDERRTEIKPSSDELTLEDLIPNKSVITFLTSKGYIKRVDSKIFEAQNRAGRGKEGISFRDDDDLQDFFTCNMHDDLLFFTSKGRVYSSKVYDLPEGTRQTKGKALINVIPIDQDEYCTSMLTLKRPYADGDSLVMLTKKGVIKKTNLSNFENIRKTGIIAINLNDNDELSWVRSALPGDHIMLATKDGMVIRYDESEVRAMGRTATGVKAIELRDNDYVVCCETFSIDNSDKLYLLLVTDDGYGKKVPINEFRDQRRGGIGLIGIKFKKRTSKLAGISLVQDTNEVTIASSGGIVLRQDACDIPSQSRMATGVRLQQLPKDDNVQSVVAHIAGIKYVDDNEDDE